MIVLYLISVALNLFSFACCYYLATQVKTYEHIIMKASQILEQDIEKMVEEEEIK